MTDFRKLTKAADVIISVADDLGTIYDSIKENASIWQKEFAMIKSYLIRQANKEWLDEVELGSRVYENTGFPIIPSKISFGEYNRFDPNALRKYIEHTLDNIKVVPGDRELIHPYDCVPLLLGTAAVESNLGRYNEQMGGGPAISIFQIEPPTIQWLHDVYSEKLITSDGTPFILLKNPDDIKDNLEQAVVYARLRYLVDDQPLPNLKKIRATYDMPENVINSYLRDLAKYWKRVYNTHLGAGTVDDFVDKYIRYVLFPYNDKTIGVI